MRILIRNYIFNILRQDILDFINDNENQIIDVVQQEMIVLDQLIPEEQMFIDIKMRKLGKELTKAILRATKRFLSEDKY